MPMMREMEPETLLEVRVDGARLLDRIMQLAAVGAIDGGGVCRLALTDEDRLGRDLVVSWMRDLGMDIRVDAIGNVIATSGGRDPSLAPVMCGSHIDTVRTGGKYDGNYGVLAGLEVIETLATAHIETERPIAVAFFTDEEGARFHPDMLGSLVYAGGMGIESALDQPGIDGARLGDELARIGYAGSHPCPGPIPHAFVEVHVEQGPVLEAEAITIGAVTGVQGIHWEEVTITGQSNHAGTTPMSMRHDAGYAAGVLAVRAREIAGEVGGTQVATVGAIDLHPNLVNVVAARAVMSVDLRNTDRSALADAVGRIGDACHAISASEGVTIERRVTADFDPVAFDERVISLVEHTAKALDHSVRRMPSGAGHDAQMLARVCPTAMIFVPSVGGLSHNVAEHTDAADLESGANVLLHTMLALSGLARSGDTHGSRLTGHASYD
jgi:N-carbamoyl-L-amino-acid hydrolase